MSFVLIMLALLVFFLGLPFLLAAIGLVCCGVRALFTAAPRAMGANARLTPHPLP